jgi:hypothetical protein
MTLDLNADIIDIRDIIERIEDLPDLIEGEGCDDQTELLRDELATLTGIMAQLKGYGGDEQWRGDWYPLLLIHERYFADYARELITDCDGLPRDLPPYIIIDWNATADNLKVDYSTVDISDAMYWYR